MSSTNELQAANKYDPNVVIQAAQDKYTEKDDFEGGQMIFQSALLTWVDDARELLANNNNNNRMEYDTLQQAIVTLWLAYAEFLSSCQQFKSAMEAYEQATHCPVAGSVGTVWLSFAQFAQDRERKRKAQDIYIRALLGTNGTNGPVQEEQDRDILWQAFLEFMQQGSNPDLTLEELQRAAMEELQKPQESSNGMEPAANQDEEPSSKRIKLMGEQQQQPSVDPSPPPLELPKNQVVSLEAVDIEAKAFLQVLQQKDVPPDILAAWMIRDGTSLAQAPEPPLFEPLPPKFSDPTAKDLLGVTLALELNQCLQSASGTILLKVCHALWTLTALTEHHAAETVAQLDQSLKQAHEQREANFANQLATATNPAVAAAVQANLEQNRRVFQTACQEQRQTVVQDVAWQLRRLLCVQQQVLTQLQVPGFAGPTVEAQVLDQQAKICSYLHAAFFLRNRIGPEPHLALLQAQAKRLQEQQEKERLQLRMESQQQQQPPPPPPVPSGGSHPADHDGYPSQGGPSPGGLYPSTYPPNQVPPMGYHGGAYAPPPPPSLYPVSSSSSSYAVQQQPPAGPAYNNNNSYYPS